MRIKVTDLKKRGDRTEYKSSERRKAIIKKKKDKKLQGKSEGKGGKWAGAHG